MEQQLIDFHIFYEKLEEMERFVHEASAIELRNFCLDNWKEDK